MAVADLPTYGYRRVWARCDGSRSGTACLWLMQRVYRIMRTHNLLLNVNPLILAVSGP